MSARIHARGNGNLQLAFGPNLALAATLRARPPHDLAAPSALGTGAANLKEALLINHFAPPVAHWTGHQAIHFLGSAALAARAEIHARHLNFHAQSPDGVFERQFEVIAQIFAALRAVASAARAPCRAAKQVAKGKQIAENIAEIGERGWIEALGPHTLEPLVTIAVIGGTLLGIAQDTIGLRRLFEPLLSILIVRIPVRMVLQGQFAVSALQPGVIALPAHAQYFVVVALGGVHFFVTATFTMAGRRRRPRKLYPGWYSSRIVCSSTSPVSTMSTAWWMWGSNFCPFVVIVSNPNFFSASVKCW